MPKPKAAVDPQKCSPQACEGGLCAAAAVCPRKVMVQDDPYETPFVEMDLCQGCFTCLQACPLKAIRKM